jgi:VWFA-related protein
MRKESLAALALSAALSAPLPGQTPQPTPRKDAPPRPAPQAAPPPERDEVVRISVNLVQLDVTVTDDKGRLVTDLKPEDFEVYEDGRPRQITYFSYVTPNAAAPPPYTAPTPRAPAKVEDKNLPPPPPPPPARLRPEQVRRSIALVVDDLGLSQTSSHQVRQALRKFVDEQMQPGDLVAIIRTGAGMGALQQFTADKRLLHAAVERVRFNLASRSDINTFAPVGSEIGVRNPQPGEQKRTDFDPIRSTVTYPGRSIDNFREEIFSVGTLGALNFVVRGLKSLPGRKSAVLFSDGFKMYTQDPGNDRVRESLQRLTDLANRASVVFYTIDPRGVQSFGFTAADNLAGPPSQGAAQSGGGMVDIHPTEWMNELQDRVDSRRREFYETQHGLSYLAEQTGGLFIRNTNDIGGAVRRAVGEQAGYYLIGYRPDDEAFKEQGGGRRFLNVSVKMRRPGLKARTRKGFYGFTDEEAQKNAPRTAAQQLFAALTSPFNSGDIGLRLTALFGYDSKRGHFTQSLLHIDSQDLTFGPTPDGQREAKIDIMAVTFGDNGKVIDQDDRPYTIRIDGRDFERVSRAGLIYTVTLPVKKPGAYQLRLAVRDAASGRVGSANQFIEVPDVRKGRLALSGLTLRGVAPPPQSAAQPTAREGEAATVPVSQSSSGGVDLNDPWAGPAGRRLRRGMILHYGFFIYNAAVDKATRRPRLSTQVRLFRDGRLVYEGRLKEFRGQPESADGGGLVAGGSLRLGHELAPAEYILQVVVLDHLGKENSQLATQWMNFELTE